MVLEFDIAVSHGQLCVFHENLDIAYNDWSKVQFAQGFTWRPNSVSFTVLEDAISCQATVQVQAEFILRSDTLRAIQVPFSAAKDCRISIGSILDETNVDIPAGEYCLVYEAGIKPLDHKRGEEAIYGSDEWRDMWCVFTFIPCDTAEAKILRQDELLNPPTPLDMDGRPA